MNMTHGKALKDKCAVVTGGGRGLGRAITKALSDAGSRVAILGRSRESLIEAAETIGDSVSAIPTDIGQSDAVREAFASIAHDFEGIDILINNAGVFPIFKVEEATDAELSQTINTNVMGTIYCIREAVPLMRTRGGGDIVNISSESVRNPFPFLSVYAASKGAVEVLSMGLRSELQSDNIRVTTVRSGRVRSGGDGLSNWNPELAERFIEAATASGHMRFTGEGMSPETMAAAVLNILTLPREANADLLELRSF